MDRPAWGNPGVPGRRRSLGRFRGETIHVSLVSVGRAGSSCLRQRPKHFSCSREINPFGLSLLYEGTFKVDF